MDVSSTFSFGLDWKEKKNGNRAYAAHGSSERNGKGRYKLSQYE